MNESNNTWVFYSDFQIANIKSNCPSLQRTSIYNNAVRLSFMLKMTVKEY